ncbi:hypothetical protein EJ07DRAFT_152674 [Lizonia empirigonia]|nr:hypothetical protein EJ07DRAFT_152674 [Lizonia empirigonia]
MTLPLGVRYYILRNNVVVPLVPVDQLPLQPRDLPHQLTPRQMNEAGWKFVGETQEPPSLFSSTTFASQSAPPTKTQYLSPDHNVRKDLVHAVQELQFPGEGSPASSVLPEHSVHYPTIASLTGRPASVADTTAPIYSRDEKRSDRHAPLISQVQPAVRQKEYCDFWMRTGECNYADFTKSREGRGCIYKHEMPSDRNKLRELGFPHGIPRWYREKTAIAAAAGDLNWSRYRMSEDNYMRKISDEPRASQSFDPSSFAHARHQSHDERKSDQTDIEASRVPLVIEDLISFDESPIALPPTGSRSSVSSSSSASSFQDDIPVVQPSKLLSQTMASTLREEHSKINIRALEARHKEQRTRNPHPVSESHEILSSIRTPIKTTAPNPRASNNSYSNEASCKNHDPNIQVSTLLDSATASAHRMEQEARQISDKVLKAKNGILPAGNCSADLDNQKPRKPFKLRSKHDFQPRKSANRITTQDTPVGLSSSKYASGSDTKKANPPSKGVQRRSSLGKGADLQSEITQRQRVPRGKLRLAKQPGSTDRQSHITQRSFPAMVASV